MNDIDRELKSLLKEAERLTFDEYCKTCHQYTLYCNDCRLNSGTGEPEMYLSARDMLLECELDSRND